LAGAAGAAGVVVVVVVVGLGHRQRPAEATAGRRVRTRARTRPNTREGRLPFETLMADSFGRPSRVWPSEDLYEGNGCSVLEDGSTWLTL
jgi:hypothetical protein